MKCSFASSLSTTLAFPIPIDVSGKALNLVTEPKAVFPGPPVAKLAIGPFILISGVSDITTTVPVATYLSIASANPLANNSILCFCVSPSGAGRLYTLNKSFCNCILAGEPLVDSQSKFTLPLLIKSPSVSSGFKLNVI